MDTKVHPDDWRTASVIVLEHIRSIIDERMPEGIEVSSCHTIIWPKGGSAIDPIRQAVATAYGKDLAWRIYQCGRVAYKGHKASPAGLGLLHLSGRTDRFHPLWTVEQRASCGTDSEILWAIDQYRRRSALQEGSTVSRPHITEGPIFATSLAQAAIEMAGFARSGDLDNLRKRLSPYAGTGNPKNAKEELTVGRYPRCVDINLKLTRNVIRASARAQDDSFSYAGNRFVLLDREIPQTLLRASIGRLLRDVVEHPLLANDDAVITSVKDDDNVGNIIFGLRHPEPALFEWQWPGDLARAA